MLTLTCAMDRTTRKADLTDVHIFSTFFYTKLLEEGPEAVSRWTVGGKKAVDIFDKKLLFVPGAPEHQQRLVVCCRLAHSPSFVGFLVHGCGSQQRVALVLVCCGEPRTHSGACCAAKQQRGRLAKG